MRDPRAPTDRPSRDDIAAAIVAHNAAGRRPQLAPDATRMLTVMFADADICRRNLDSLIAEGFTKGTVLRLLRDLSEAGFLSKTRGVSHTPNTYQLHLPPQAQP